MQCIQCQSITPNPKFCSRSCAATYNNTRYPKRGDAPKINCKGCGKQILKSARQKYCNKNCKPLMLNGERTLKELLDTSNAHRATIHSRIRQSARSIANKLGMTSCKKCGYNLHVEVCHIRAISSFPLSAKLKEINDPSNLAPYCRNHHWEFDNGYLKP